MNNFREVAREVFEKVSSDTMEHHGCVWTCTESESFERLVEKALLSAYHKGLRKAVELAKESYDNSYCLQCDDAGKTLRAIEAEIGGGE